MADNLMIELEALLDKVQEDPSPDFIREALSVLAASLMELEVARHAGAEKGEHSEDRKDYRNGYRGRRWDTRAGSLQLEVPRLRNTAYTPCFLPTRRRGEKALLCVIQEAYVHGVSTRKVERLLRAMGLDGISKSEVSRVCKDLDQVVEEFRSRKLSAESYPYLWLDACYEKVRIDGHVVSNAVVVAYGVLNTGEREVLGVDIGPSENEDFWKQFLRSLVDRGLKGVRLVISDAHSGLKRSIQEVLAGAAWQRCRVHFMRNALSRVSRRAQPLLSATLKTIFAQPTQTEARKQIGKIVRAVRRKHPKVAELLDKAGDDVIAYMGFPVCHWRQIHSTNPLERINREIKRRTDVVGIFPNPASVIRLVGMLLVEQNEEWSVTRRYFAKSTMERLNPEKQLADDSLLLDDGEVAA